MSGAARACPGILDFVRIDAGRPSLLSVDDNPRPKREWITKPLRFWLGMKRALAVLERSASAKEKVPCGRIRM